MSSQPTLDLPADAEPTTGPFVLAYTPDEVANLLRVSVRTIDELIRAGSLAAIRVGRHRRITPAAVEEFIAAQPWQRSA